MMATAIRVLFVDDESPLLDIGKVFLEKSGDFTVMTATSASDAIRLLEQERFDVIVSDYQMPDMDGIQFLKHLKAEGNTTPFIIFTGKGREEVVIEALNGGADGYLQKGGESEAQFAELSHKIKQAASRKRVEGALRETENRYRTLAESSTDNIFIIGRDDTVQFVNSYAAGNLHLPADEIIGKPRKNFFHLDIADTQGMYLQKVFETGEPFREEDKILYGNQEFWQDTALVPLKDETGNITAVLGVSRDITDRKRAEEALKESEERFQLAINATKDGLWEWDIQTNQEFFSPRWCEIIGYSFDDPELSHTYNSWASRIHPDDYDRVISALKNHLEKGTNYDVDYRHRHKSGEYRWQNSVGKAVFDETGKPAKMVGCISDITERKRAEEALRESEERFRSYFNMPLHGIAITSPRKGWIEVNDRICSILGYTRDELFRMNWAELTHPDDLAADVEQFNRVLSGQIEQYAMDKRFIRKDGGVIWTNITVGCVRKSDGNVDYTIGLMEDITERKQAEEALRESKEKYRMLVDTTGTGFVIIDDQGQVLDANLEYVHLTGHMSLEEIAGRNMIEWTAAYAKDKNAEAVSQCMMDGYIRNFEIDYVNASGTIIPIEINATVLRSGDAVQILALCRDITERKRAEVALVESEVFNRGLVENLPDYIVVYGTDGKILYVNPATERALGYNAEELVGTSVLSYVALECRDVATAKMAARREGDNPSAYELDIIAQDGQRRSVIAKGTPIQYHDRPAILMLLIDITERKQVEDALVVSEARFRDRTAELSVTNLKLKKEIEDRIKIQKKLILSATEKDLLLREVHHRVKNNLQLIIGLIDMTKTRAHEPVVLSTLTSIMAKVQTMGLIHTQLYESKRVDKVSMKRQVQDLVDMIAGFYDRENHDITTNINCPDIYLPVDLAIPCALALNEIISNIHKHAFMGRRNGLVEISLSVKGDRLRIAVRDNGVGLPSGFNIEKSNRLGLKLMRTLVEQQLHGSVQITGKAGTEIVIEFCIGQGEEEYGTGTGS